MKEFIKASKRRKIFMLVALLLITMLISSVVIVSLANQKVEMAVVQVPNIDIILAKLRTRVDLTNFVEDVKTSLESQGISRDKVNISAIETQEANIQTSFNWSSGTDVSSSIGSISITNNGRNVVMKGNPSKPGKNAIWIIPDGNQDQEFNMTYNIDFGDSFNAAGMLLRVQKTGNTLTGYMLSFNNSKWVSAAGGSNGAIWEFSYGIGQNSTNMTKTLKKALTINTSGTLNVKASDTEIVVSGGGLSTPVTYATEKTFGNGFGFFSDHYSHGCNSIGSFTLSNMELKTSVVKDFNEVLQQPSWRDGSLRVLVNVTDVTEDQFNDNNQVSSIVSKLFNDDIYYVGWGTGTNKAQIENIIQKNDNKGLYLDNSNYSKVVLETAKYIKSLISGIGENQYIIAGEDAEVAITPSGIASGTIDSEWPNGRWKAIQDMDYFENSNGQYELTGVYTDSVISKFEKVGKYEIYYEDEKIVPGEIYVHRRPVASFDMQVKNTKVELKSTSYDLDKQSDNNGISEEEWSYKKIADTDWTIGKLETVEEGTTYIVRLRVKDFQNTWSNYETKYIAGDEAQAPIAAYKIVNSEISVYKKLEIIDASYDPAGLNLTKYEWKVEKGSTTVYTGTAPLLDYNNAKYGPGTYTMSLIVTNEKGTVSEEFKRTYKITEDVTAPEIIANPITAETINKPIEVSLEFKDEESGFKSYKYAITESKEAPKSWSKEIAKEKDIIVIDEANVDKDVYLHVKGLDNAGNESADRVLGPYRFEIGYEIQVQAVDLITKAGIEGIEFKVIAEKEDGTEVEIEGNIGKTNKDGKIILKDVGLRKINKIKIENTSAKAGYKKAEYKVVTTDTTDYNITIIEEETSNDIETMVAADKQSLTVKVPLEREKIKVKLTNVDSEINSIKLNGTTFVMKSEGVEVARGTTENGEAILDLPITEVNTTSEYVLEQVNEVEGYIKTDATTLSFTFDINGALEKIEQKGLIVKNKDIQIVDNGVNGEIIVKNERIDKETFSVNINVVDKDDSDKKVEGSSYKVRVEGEKGLNYETAAKMSDGNGDILIEGLIGRGLMKLTFVHEEAASGYGKEKEEESKYITITRKVDGTIEYNKASYEGVFEKVEGNKTIYVTLSNEQKEKQNALKIRVVSETNSTVGIEGIGFEVRKMLGNQLIGEGYTNEEGIFEICPMLDDGVGEVAYKIIPKESTQNGVTINNTIIMVVYGKTQNIIEASQLTANANTQVYYASEEEEKVVKDVAEVVIRAKVQEIYGENKLIILKQDEDTKEGIDGAQYRVKIKANMTLTDVKTTENGGKIESNLPETDNIVVEITEVKTVDGYNLDETVKQVTLKRDKEGKLVVFGMKNLLSENVRITEEGNLEIIEKSRKIENTLLTFNIAKTNKNEGLLLGGVKFNIKEEKLGYSKDIITNQSGYVTLEDIRITEARDYRFIITETETIKPYKLPDQSLVIELHFEEIDGMIVYKGITYLSGDEILGSKKATYKQASNELTVELTVRNYTPDDFGFNDVVYELDLEKVDKDGNKIEGSKYDIEIRPYGESRITGTAIEVTDNVEVTDLVLTKEITTILFKEVKAGLGFNIDSSLKVLSLYNGEDGEIEYIADTTSGELEISIEDVEEDGIQKKRIHVKIKTKDAEEVTNDDKPTKPEEPEIPEEPETPDEPMTKEEIEEKATFKVRLFNRNYGSWNRSYMLYKYYRCGGHRYYYTDYYYRCHNTYYCNYNQYGTAYPYEHSSSSPETHDLVGTQRLYNFFEPTGEYNFYNLPNTKTTIISRLVEGGEVSEEIYEESSSYKNDAITDETGTNSVYFLKEYANKTVEFTIIEEMPEKNHKRIEEKKVIVKFDENGKIISGNIESEGDVEEFAIGGISAEGIVEGIELTTAVHLHIPTGKQVDLSKKDISISKYNSIGQNTMYVGVLNKEMNNPTKIKLDLKDYDTDDKLSGSEFNIIAAEVNKDGTITLLEEYNKQTNTEGKIELQVKDTYANRIIRYHITQVKMPTVSGIPYKSTTGETIEVDVKYDNDGNILEVSEENMPKNAKLVEAEIGETTLVFEVTNEMEYNFSINVNKVNEEGEPLEGVRINTVAKEIVDATTGSESQRFRRGSALTDKDGYVKLKVYLPITGSSAYYNKTIKYYMDEYHVTDGYKAVDNLSIIVKYDKVGNVQQAEVKSVNEEGQITITEATGDHVNLTLKNKKLETLPKFEIKEVDSEDAGISVDGVKYKVTSWDEATYGITDVTVKEQFYSSTSNEKGEMTINFEKGHALKTIIYTLEQTGVPNSYNGNKNIVVRVQYDKNGKVKTTKIISEQYIDGKKAVKIIGNPVGSTTIQLEVRNELKPQFEIRLSKYDKILTNFIDGKKFRVYSYVKNADGTLGDVDEIRTSLETKDGGNTTIGFRKAHPNETMVYKIYEINTLNNEDLEIERGTLEVKFDQYGNEETANVTGEYLVARDIDTKNKYARVRVDVESFRMNIELRSKNNDEIYSLAGAKYEIQTSMNEESRKNATNSFGNVIEIVGERHKGKEVTYKVHQVAQPYDYEATEDFEIKVIFDENGVIKRCSPMNEGGKFDVISTVRDINGVDMTLRMWNVLSPRNSLELNLVDESDENIKISEAEFEVKATIDGREKVYTLKIEDGKGIIDLGPDKHVEGKAIVYTIKQKNTDYFYIENNKPAQLSVQYDENGNIINGTVITTDGYMKVISIASDGRSIELETRNKRKVAIEIENEDYQTAEKIDNSRFKITQVSDGVTYTDSNITNTEGKVLLMVGPYYRGETKKYKIEQTASLEHTKILPFEIEIVYDENGLLKECKIPENVSKYVEAQIINRADTEDGQLDIRDISIKIKNEPMITIGVQAIDTVTKQKLVGGKYKIREISRSKYETLITTSERIEHVAIEDTVPGTLRTYEIVETNAPRGYKYKIAADRQIGTIETRIDTDGYIIPGTTKITSGYDYIKLLEPVDKTDKFDIDLSIEYEEVEEFTVVIENVSVVDSTSKVESTLTGTTSTGQTISQKTDKDTGIAEFNFGKQSANTTIRLVVSQGNVVGNYATSAPIHMNIEFDESGQIKNVLPQSGTGIATQNVSYVIENTGKYIIKIKLMNQPETKFNIINVENGDENKKLANTLNISGEGFNTTKVVSTEYGIGASSVTLDSAPKSRTVNYTIVQSDVSRGYKKNNNMTVQVVYDADGRISSASPIYTTTADSSMFAVTRYDKYNVDIKILNKKIFTVYVEAVDRYDEAKKISGIHLNIYESTYSRENVNLETDENGLAQSTLGTNMANGRLTYEVTLQTYPDGYTKLNRTGSYRFAVNVRFDESGNILNVTSDSDLIEVSFENEVAVNIKVKYTPLLDAEIIMINSANNLPLSGKKLNVSSSQMIYTGYVEKVTDTNGKISITDSEILKDSTVRYNINEITSGSTDYNYTVIKDEYVDVTYDSKGYVSKVTVSNEEIMEATYSGRKIEVKIYSNKNFRVSLINVDEFEKTERILGKYDIVSSKGDKVEITTVTTEHRVGMEFVGYVYAGEEVTYTLHQTAVNEGYEALPDIEFKVKFGNDGTIEAVNSTDERLEILGVRDTIGENTAHVDLQIKSRAKLSVKINVKDSMYNSGVENLKFKVINESTGVETEGTAGTNANGDVVIPVSRVEKSKIVIYRIEQTETKGGYARINPIRVVVEYNAAGTIEERGTYIESGEGKLDFDYTKDLYDDSRQKGIEIDIETKSKFGVGVINQDKYTGQVIEGTQFYIHEKVIDNDESQTFNKVTDKNGETTEYIREMDGSVKIVEYTLIQVNAPKGYRKVNNVTVRIFFDEEGNIISRRDITTDENVKVEVATDRLLKMGSSKEVVHLKFTVNNDNRITFKVVNKDTNIPSNAIKGSIFNVTTEVNGNLQISGATLTTDGKGEASLAGIEGTGTIKIYYNQTKVAAGYVEGTAKSGYITIEKQEGEYRIVYKDSTDGIEYKIDNEHGTVTVYIENENELSIDIYNIDGKTSALAPGAIQKYSMYVGEKTEKESDILKGEEIPVNGGVSYIDNVGQYKIKLGSTHVYIGKKVVIKLVEEREATGYPIIDAAYFVVEFDKDGKIEKAYGISARTNTITKNNAHGISVFVKHGDLDEDVLRIIKESEDGKVRINGTEFKVTVKVDGTTVKEYETVKTEAKEMGGVIAEEGIAEIQDYKYEGNITLLLEETKAAEGYSAVEAGEILKVEYIATNESGKIVVSDIKTNSTNIQAVMNAITGQMEVIVKNAEKMKLEIEKVDESGNKIIGNKVSVSVMDENNPTDIRNYGEMLTNNLGKVIYQLGRDYKNTAVNITITQERTAGFMDNGKIIIKVHFDADGKIIIPTTEITKGTEFAKITDVTEYGVSIKIVGKAVGDTIKLKLIKENATDAGIRLKDVMFQVKITPEVGINLYNVLTSDEKGEIEVNGIVGSGNIQIEILEIMAPNGYMLGEENGYFVFKMNRDAETGAMKKVSSNIADDKWEIHETNEKIEIHIPNEQDSVGLAINKVDKGNGMSIKGASFKVVEEGTGKEYTAITDEKGIAYIALEKKETAGVYKYIIKETAAPKGYELDEKEKQITISYNESGEIADAEENTDGIMITKQESKYIKVEISNEPKYMGIDPFNVEIINVDSEDRSIRLPKGEFEIKIMQEEGVGSITKQADENGNILLENINGVGNIKIEIVQKTPAIGYVLNTDPRTVEIERNASTGQTKILKSDNLYPVYDAELEKLTIYVSDDKEHGKFTLIINKVNEDGVNIKDNTEIEVDIDGDKTTGRTDEEGRIIIRNLSIPEKPNFKIELTEKIAPEGYQIDEKTRIINCLVEKVYDRLKLLDVKTEEDNISIKNTTSNLIEITYKNEKTRDDDELYLTSEKYEITETLTKKVSPYTTVKAFIENLESNGELTVFKADGSVVAEEQYVGTGMIIKASKGDKEITKTIVVMGDITGDGEIKALDVSKFNQHYIDKKPLSGIYLEAADTNNDGKISALDASRIRRAYVGVVTL